MLGFLLYFLLHATPFHTQHQGVVIYHDRHVPRVPAVIAVAAVVSRTWWEVTSTRTEHPPRTTTSLRPWQSSGRWGTTLPSRRGSKNKRENIFFQHDFMVSTIERFYNIYCCWRLCRWLREWAAGIVDPVNTHGYGYGYGGVLTCTKAAYTLTRVIY